jgi:glycosyltransferase involved in cell wall biosynthesis
MGDTPLVTVITPAYNVAKYIAETVESVRRQTIREFEYLVVDDGSTDHTTEIVEAAAGDFPELRLVATAHAGSAAARNAGIAEARGRFIAFVDGDDRWHPSFLERQTRLLQSLPSTVAAVFCRGRVITHEGSLAGFRWQPSGPYDFDEMLVRACAPRSGSSLLLRRECFDEAGLFDSQLASAVDFEMWLRIQKMSAAPVFWGSRHYLYDMRVRPDAISTNLAGRLAALEQVLVTYASHMNRLPAACGYVRPSVFAFRTGHEELGQRWGETACRAGRGWLLRDSYGRRLVSWLALRPEQRDAVRWASRQARRAVNAGIASL